MAGGYKKRRRFIVFVLSGALFAFLILSSAAEKNGAGFLPPGLKIPGADQIRALLEEIPKMPGVDFARSLFEEYSGGYPSAQRSAEIENPGVSVHFIDVGQAKAILVTAPEKNLLIDAGESDQGPRVIRYLVNHGVRTVDTVIGTHPHSDHIGGLSAVIGGMPVSTVILPLIPEEITPTTATYTGLLRSVSQMGVTLTPAVPGAQYDLGGGAVLTLLGPVGEYGDLNDVSVVSRLTYGEISFLFTGDAAGDAERDLLNTGADLSASVLDVPHHGSDTSSSKAFLSAANPAVAVISCGLDNMYGHPHKEVVAALRSYTRSLYRTDTDGTVVVLTDGKEIQIQTEKGGEN